MFLIEFLPPRPHLLWSLATQMGIDYCVVKAAPESTGLPPPWEPETLRTIHRELSSAGLKLLGLEGDPFDMSRIKLGLPGRDEDIAHYKRMLQTMGELGIPLLCYNFSAGFGWHRSTPNAPGRGGALVTRFDLGEIPSSLTAAGVVSEQTIFDNYKYFLKAILPKAQQCGVRLGAHPDDPPLSPLRGIGRVLSSAASFEQALAIDGAHHHGLTFCQANWKLMSGPDGPETQVRLAQYIRQFVGTGRVHFVHLRDVRGKASCFEETFHDNGPTDLATMLKIYHDAGFRGPVRCDHVPTLAGEINDSPGYGTLGRLFADGYLLGLMEALRVRTPAEDWISACP